MASVLSQVVGRKTLALTLGKQGPIALIAQRRLASNKSASQEDDNGDAPAKGWLKRLLPVRAVDPGHESHSSLLSDKDTVYELQFHAVKPEFMMKYLTEFHTFVDTVHEKKTGAQLAGSWTVEVGDQDEAVHLWKYPGGYPVLNRAREIYRNDGEFIDFRVNRNKMLRSRKNQILLPFSFWGDIKNREGKNIYELRSYTLKPGTMIEWGNNWAKGIKFRQEKNEAVGGYFAHIGDLYEAQHLWAYETLQERDRIRMNAWHSDGWHDVIYHTAYEDLQSRKEVRENAWMRPGWDECVSHTVPLIRHMTSRILIPTPFSPLQ